MAFSDISIRKYYASRAPIYDRVYQIPERQEDLRYLEGWIPTVFKEKSVLEIACGTGYWTQFIAPVAKEMAATDINEETLKFAEARIGVSNVRFRVEDAFRLSDSLGSFDAAFAGLWLSHVPKERFRAFFINLHKHLSSGAVVLLIDNSKAQCRELPIAETDVKGNTYQTRVLDDGTSYRVLKNFPSKKELSEVVGRIGVNADFRELEHFWIFQYETK